ncbi:MAG: sugar phosphate isomerase/epimerase [Candidatus Hydrogenedentes bacterium]|nr:sugar phosphate isomerase/epimerase [Candidatus Hydrogenedentota bacterium]
MKHPDEIKMTRRQAVAALGSLAVAATGVSRAQESKAPARMALQLYTLRDPAKQDLKGTLKKAREMGWEYVQWSGMPDLPAEQIRAALDEAGLKAMAAHTGVEPFETDFEKSVTFWKTVGVEAVGPGGMMGDCRETLADWLRGAKRFDVLGAKLREAGLRLTYHNHAGEFEKFPEDPRCKLDILFESTDPKNLSAELDLAWVKVGNANPAAYIRKCKGRVHQVHAKDVAEGKKGERVKFTPLGQGSLDWNDIFAAGKEAGIEWYIYEQDNGEGSPFDYAKASYDFLSKRTMGG